MSLDESYLIASPPLDRVETERMICERMRPEHAAELVAHLRDPRVARWLSITGQPPTELAVIEGLAAKVAHWDRHGFGLWVLRDRATSEMVGRGGLQHTFVAGMQEIELAWSIAPERWGEGLATELALASTSAGFGRPAPAPAGRAHAALQHRLAPGHGEGRDDLRRRGRTRRDAACGLSAVRTSGR